MFPRVFFAPCYTTTPASLCPCSPLKVPIARTPPPTPPRAQIPTASLAATTTAAATAAAAAATGVATGKVATAATAATAATTAAAAASSVAGSSAATGNLALLASLGVLTLVITLHEVGHLVAALSQGIKVCALACVEGVSRRSPLVSPPKRQRDALGHFRKLFVPQPRYELGKRTYLFLNKPVVASATQKKRRVIRDPSASVGGAMFRSVAFRSVAFLSVSAPFFCLPSSPYRNVFRSVPLLPFFVSFRSVT